MSNSDEGSSPSLSDRVALITADESVRSFVNLYARWDALVGIAGDEAATLRALGQLVDDALEMAADQTNTIAAFYERSADAMNAAFAEASEELRRNLQSTGFLLDGDFAASAAAAARRFGNSAAEHRDELRDRIEALGTEEISTEDRDANAICAAILLALFLSTGDCLDIGAVGSCHASAYYYEMWEEYACRY
jgi:hypothetical protein